MAEDEMEAFLLRLAPGFRVESEGASADEISRIEKLAGEELPPFYKWLLGRVGRHAGPLPKVFRAFYARNVIEAHVSEVDPDPPTLFIARLEDPLMPLDLFYDLSQRVRDDARVDAFESNGDLTASTETLREWLAWRSLLAMRIDVSGQRCHGTFVDREGDLSGQLTQTLADLGFVSSVPTGRFCMVFERDDASLACKVSAKPENAYMLSFDLGGPNIAVVRRILGEIAVRTQIKVNISDWAPPLSAQ